MTRSDHIRALREALTSLPLTRAGAFVRSRLLRLQAWRMERRFGVVRDRTVPLLAGGGIALAGVLGVLAFGARDETAVAGRTQAELAVLIENAAALNGKYARISDSLSVLLDRASEIPSVMPTAGWLSSEYAQSRLHPIHGADLPHHGIDVAAPRGTPVIAPAAGTVTKVDRTAGYGLMLEVDHGKGIVTRYAHLSRIFVVKGQDVLRGDNMAAVGNTGLSTGPHLHYEIIVRGEPVDPLTYVVAIDQH